MSELTYKCYFQAEVCLKTLYEFHLILIKEEVIARKPILIFFFYQGL